MIEAMFAVGDDMGESLQNETDGIIFELSDWLEAKSYKAAQYFLFPNFIRRIQIELRFNHHVETLGGVHETIDNWVMTF